MGFLRAMSRTGANTAPVLEASVATQVRTGIRSPWVTGALSPVVYRDLFGNTTDGPVSRAEAVTIPAVSKGLALVTSSLAQCPLVVLDGDTPVETPRWMYATDGTVAPQYRMGFVIEDLVLSGWSVLIVDRDDSGAIVSADRVRADLWTFDDLGNVVIGQEIADPASVIVIKGPHDGILNTGARALRAAINLELAWSRSIRNPLPATVLQQVGDDQLEDDEIDDLLSAWRTARQDPDGAVAYIPATINVQAIGALVPDLLVEARNASAVDIARLIGVPSSSVDAGQVQTSLTYSNTNIGLGYVLVQQGLQPYANAVSYALSMDSVVPAGQRTVLDTSSLLADAANVSGTGPKGVQD